MAIAIFFLITWLFCTVFVVIKKELSIIENTFVFLFILVININFSWIIIEEMKQIKLTHNGVIYAAYLLNRSIIIPMLAIILVNLIARSKDHARSLIYFFTIVAISFCLSLLSDHFKITVYTKWDFRYDLFYYFVLYLLAFYIYKLFRKVCYDEVKTP